MIKVRTNSPAVTYCARAKLLNLIDEKFGAFFVSKPEGSLELHLYDVMPAGLWVKLEATPRVFVDQLSFQKLRQEDAIDFDYDTYEFVIHKGT